MFSLKADPPFPDDVLRALGARARATLAARIPEARRLLGALGIAGDVEPLAAGTYHVVHLVVRPDAIPLVMRSTIPDCAVEDRGLLIEGWVADWIAARGIRALVPPLRAVGFANERVPFDYAILDRAEGVVVRDIGDSVLDEMAPCLTAIGRALRAVHGVRGDGAGLLDLTGPLRRPRGVHDSWPDYIGRRLADHVAICAGAGLIDRKMEGRIRAAFETMSQSLADRPMCLLHGDLGNHNVCIDPETGEVTGLLDWEDALVGDPLFDIAMWWTFHPARRHQAFLSGYGLASPSTQERRLLALYFLRIALSKTVHRLRFAVPDRTDRAPAHLRISQGVEMLEQIL